MFFELNVELTALQFLFPTVSNNSTGGMRARDTGNTNSPI